MSNPTKKELLDFFIDNSSIDKIAQHANKFNPINIMGMKHMEIRHSKILAWLLNPNENHGLGDEVLKRFLTTALNNENLKQENNQNTYSPSITPADIYTANLHDAIVKCEWANIDIFIECPTNKWVFIVENKVQSKQHSGQLTRYSNLISKRYNITAENCDTDKYKLAHIFLTKSRELPDASGDDDYKGDLYHPIGHKDVLNIVTNLTNINKEQLSNRVYNFIQYYLEILREILEMTDNDLIRLSKELYQKNKKVLDFIYEHAQSTEFSLAIDEYFLKDMENSILEKGQKNKKQTITYFAQNKTQFSFLPTSWIEGLTKYKEAGDWGGCEKWWHAYPFISYIQLDTNNEDKTGKLRLYTEIGPYSNRAHFIEAISHIKNENKYLQLNTLAMADGKASEGKYSKITNLKNFTVKIKDINDASEIQTGIGTLINDLLDNIKTPILEIITKYQPCNNDQLET